MIEFHDGSPVAARVVTQFLRVGHLGWFAGRAEFLTLTEALNHVCVHALALAGGREVMTEIEFVNSRPVLAYAHTPGGRGTRPGRVLLLASEGEGEFTAAWQAAGADDWSHGEYHRDLDAALATFEKRVRERTRALAHGWALGARVDGRWLCALCAPAPAAFVVAGQVCERCHVVVHAHGLWRPSDGVDALTRSLDRD